MRSTAPLRIRWDRVAWWAVVFALAVVAWRTADAGPPPAAAVAGVLGTRMTSTVSASPTQWPSATTQGVPPTPPAGTGAPAPQAVPPAQAAASGIAAAAPGPSVPGCARIEPEAVVEAPGYGRTVALTFDDGPGEWTDDVLDVLDRYRVPATFFVIGRQVEADPGLVRRAVEAGHLIGNHTWSHEPPPGDPWPEDFTAGQFRRTSDAIATATGRDPCWFRPPQGVMTGVEAAADTLGVDVALWSVDSLDWRVQSGAAADPGGALADTIVANATSGIDDDHPLVLLHDGGGYRGATVAALPRIIEAYRDAGFRFVRLDDVSALGRVRR